MRIVAVLAFIAASFTGPAQGARPVEFSERPPESGALVLPLGSAEDSNPTVPDGMAGFGVRLLDRFVRDFRPVPAGAAQGD